MSSCCRLREQNSSSRRGDIAAVFIGLGPGVSVMVVPVYLPSLDEVDAELELLKDFVDRNKGKSFLIVCELNAKSTHTSDDSRI